MARPEKKAPKTGKTDALRAQREAQHREMLAQRAERERAAKVAPKKKREDLPSLNLPPLDVKAEEMPLTFKLWQKACQTYADEHVALSLGDIWSGDYDLADAADDAFLNGQLPSEFVEAQFAEDIARQAWEDQERADSLEHNAEEEGPFGDSE